MNQKSKVLRGKRVNIQVLDDDYTRDSDDAVVDNSLSGTSHRLKLMRQLPAQFLCK